MPSLRLAQASRALHDVWADTTSAHGRLMVTILAGLGEFERELILSRTGDGRARAKARGVRFGRPASLTSHQRQEARRLHRVKRKPTWRGPTLSVRPRFRGCRRDIEVAQPTRKRSGPPGGKLATAKDELSRGECRTSDGVSHPTPYP